VTASLQPDGDATAADAAPTRNCSTRPHAMVTGGAGPVRSTNSNPTLPDPSQPRKEPTMQMHDTVSREHWIAARQALLAQEEGN